MEPAPSDMDAEMPPSSMGPTDKDDEPSTESESQMDPIISEISPTSYEPDVSLIFGVPEPEPHSSVKVWFNLCKELWKAGSFIPEMDEGDMKLEVELAVITTEMELTKALEIEIEKRLSVVRGMASEKAGYSLTKQS